MVRGFHMVGHHVDAQARCVHGRLADGGILERRGGVSFRVDAGHMSSMCRGRRKTPHLASRESLGEKTKGAAMPRPRKAMPARPRGDTPAGPWTAAYAGMS